MSGTKTGINWIGLYTIVRREVSRMMRVPIQAFIAPWISALLFIFIFGYVVGGRISSIGGVPYIRFVLPGILMMNIVNASFLQSSSAIYFSRFLRFIEETLVSPMSYTEMVAGSLVVVVVRSTVTALGILVMGLAFGATTIQSIPAFLYWVVAVSMIFGLMGIVIGLWSKSFEQLNVLTVFFITPLSMVGGVFNTVDMLPTWLRFLAWGNPFFYFINGIRHSMIGFSETPAGVGYAFTTLLAVAMFLWVLRLYSRGYGLRE
ncbi:MAG TPA: ABC transporter permease [Rhizomicrobium sp.]|jgi:ABC-2 type transport system permease protein|nr:ABC transporter permease [Rhizomicrobium sp.]